MKTGLVVLFLFLALAVFGWQHGFKGQEHPLPIPTSASQSLCPQEEIEIIMPDESMGAFIKQGEKLKLIRGWYECHPALVGDFVYYRFSQSFAPVARVVRAAAGDKFELVRDSTRPAWNIQINGSLLKLNELPYFFGTEVPPLLSLYQKSRANGLNPGEVLVFSGRLPSYSDSGDLGVVNVADFVGKIEPQ